MTSLDQRHRGTSIRDIRRGKAIVQPGMAVKPREILKMYSAGTLEERILGYYNDSFEFPGEENPPDFSKMDRIERLELLHEKRKEVRDLKDQVVQQTTAAEARKAEAKEIKQDSTPKKPKEDVKESTSKDSD